MSACIMISETIDPAVFTKSVTAVGVSMLVGAVMIVLISVRKKKQVSPRQLWLKYFVYVLLIAGMIAGIVYDLSRYIIPVLLAGGLIEMIRVAKTAPAKPSFRKVLASVLVYMIIAGFCAFMPMAGSALVLQFYTWVVIFDAFSQLFGQLLGRTKLAPVTSPAKTTEGFIGGFLMLYATVLWMMPDVSWTGDFLIAFPFAVVALGGDLLASKYKRMCGVKDFSSVIPGHGGILDRFDSFFFTGAVWIFLLALLALFLGGWGGD
ncbi:MAG TPA: phosphatidate cytidylyltransferase [Bacteroidia bacterium]|nr:phosphatidate cytidylyltransferase [Bacteroidia bacterium]